VGCVGAAGAGAVTIVFVHPELGLGGAERLVLDAATELRARGHRVVLLTAECDPAHAFPEAIDGSLDVRVHGRAIPHAIAGRLRAPCAIVRMAWLGRALGRLEVRPDVVVCDLVAHVVPWLRRAARAPLALYCHHPDRLLTSATGRARRWYRAPIDRLEETGTAAADRVIVNSEFTARRLHDAFPRLTVSTTVVYPGVAPSDCPDLPDEPPGPITILAMGRFSPEKRLEVAVDAFARLRDRMAPPAFARMRLVLAGAYDARLPEPREVVARLEASAGAHGLATQVELRRSPSEDERRALLGACRFLVHTHPDEHFGYAPVEAMAAGRPVVAIRSGGPEETVVDGETGILCAPSPDAIADAMARLATDHVATARMGRAGRVRVAARFSRAAFGARFEDVLRELAEGRRAVS
jgi:alpha-1,3/alpha-1,6-mannosyltransferase